ncbi:ROK family protein (putative glucokinase) [Fulvivirga imtechensis AK7]|uniref:ROK family protein (Putative glucokinase) n=1 Tax=Fulvivirga imtechensis AK7 TaxID=1237149 RepID=L8JHJ7_9BACT|nr:ROK family protein [Fulvivirga imtechensis]ELR68321.1 ROK family protein (putative glucokinase) [Fulvivirga imtechensis AK7]
MLIAVGVDVGGTNTKLGAVTQDGKIIHKRRFSTRDQINKEAFLETLSTNIKMLISDIGKEYVDLAGIGIGAPKANFYTGKVVGAANLAWQGAVNLRQFLHDQFQVPVIVTNDANLAAVGENEFGAAREMKNFLSVTIGTGLGCGIYINGELFHGQNDMAGELGHTSVKFKGRYCECGKQGCLEAYVSAKGLIRTTLKLLSKYEDESELRAIASRDLTPDKISSAALRGDSMALKIYQYTGDILGYKLSDVIAMYNPEAIFLTGGIANAQSLLFEPTRRSIHKYIYKSYSDPIRLLPSALQDDEISVLGGGALVWKHLENKMAIVH